MFCPEEHIPLLDVVGWCDHVSAQFWSAENMRRFKNDEINEDSGLKSFQEKEVLTCWLIAKCLEIYPSKLCSPSGKILVPSQFLFFHEDRLNWYQWSWPVWENDELSLSWRHFAEGIHPADRFRFIDMITGTVQVVGREEKIKSLGIETDEDVIHQISVVAPLNGWAVCFEQESFPTSVTELASDVGLNGPYLEFAEQDTSGKSVGRPWLQGIALKAYDDIFPNGHGETPWSIVEDRIEQLAGRRISSKTIKRAIDTRTKPAKNGQNTRQ